MEYYHFFSLISKRLVPFLRSLYLLLCKKYPSICFLIQKESIDTLLLNEKFIAVCICFSFFSNF